MAPPLLPAARPEQEPTEAPPFALPETVPFTQLTCAPDAVSGCDAAALTARLPAAGEVVFDPLEHEPAVAPPVVPPLHALAPAQPTRAAPALPAVAALAVAADPVPVPVATLALVSPDDAPTLAGATVTAAGACPVVPIPPVSASATAGATTAMVAHARPRSPIRSVLVTSRTSRCSCHAATLSSS
jgi:hypothetical protein